MLKALQLVGFKSFADKTRFEFPPGITVVVGPNGSGKSNIVDAIKWVLGEQSVKSLRGKEMADVIFNGSGTRRELNTADVVLTFDNANRRLPVETDEVHVGRRVYRSGEGEYLINGQPCRLRDVRDMFAGTGVSAQHYSIIEQGKVDSMLQASPRDRRVIFEEAAGISRFKAKKIEALRRLERVDQNLLRLSDIVDEVEARLKSVRKQAGKAQRYKQYTDRLQELRTQVGLTDWRRLTEEIERLQNELAEARMTSVELSARNEALETRNLELEQEVEAAEQSIHQSEQTIAENRERIAACESTIEHERSRRRDLDQEIQRRQRQLATMSSRTRDLGSQLESTLQDVTAAESRYRQIREQSAEIENALSQLDEQLGRLRAERDERRERHALTLRQDGELAGEVTSLEAKIQTATAAIERSTQRIEQLETARLEVTGELTRLETEASTNAAALQQCEQSWKAAKQQLDASQKEFSEIQQQLGELRSNLSGASERAAVLEELQRRQDGLNAGVKQVLTAAQEATDGPFKQIVGLVADIFDVQVEMAPLIDAALGHRAEHVVVQPGHEFTDFLRREAHPFTARVGFVLADGTNVAVSPPTSPTHSNADPADTADVADTIEPTTDPIDLEGKPGVVGRADRFVQTSPRFAGLLERLLGTTWIVADLGRAMMLADEAPGQSFVTLAGQLLSGDGTLYVGPKQSTTGLVSRRSELRELRSRINDLTEKMELTADAAEQLSVTVADAAARTEMLSEDRETLRTRAAEWQRLISTAEERQAQLDDKLNSAREESERARTECEAASSALTTVRNRRQQIAGELAELEEVLRAGEQRVKDVDAQRQRRAGEATAAKVELAKCEQHLEHLTNRLRQYEQDQEERQRAIDEAGSHLEEATGRAQQCDRKILQLEGAVAELYLRKESLARDSVKLAESREQLRNQRGEVHVEAQKVRGQIRKVEQDIHEQDLKENQLRLERETLETRMRDDYGIELAKLQHEPTDEEELHEREAIEEEISDLRRKIQNIGSVNLDALEELEDLEKRFTDLSRQYADLSAAKKSLEQIIEKINVDSRRLFVETLESVRVHFQELFRKLFGGGQADIITDDHEDILESGLEIVARPPGKELRSISLLSGGEKTLTCVALLLAIFRNRPSPFCVLDEVDAALDEANVGRFIVVLREFLQWTQFIVVTHSKKTMTCANTLYGVTMQESGISRRVSVRFEDVSETGEILRTRDEDESGEPNADEDETQAA